MKHKLMVSFIILMLVVFSVVFAQGLSKQERLEIKQQMLKQEVEENRMTQEQADEIYKNIEERMTNCDYNCVENQNCPMVQQNSNYGRHHNDCLTPNNHCRRTGTRQMCH